MLSKSIFILLFVGSFVWAAPNNVRKTTVSLDELTTIKAAVGIATIIQLPEPVQTVIIGDSGAFKIEYLDKAITIKPLRYGAKTNLYVNTKERRYNLRLTTVTQDQSDYVVYVEQRVYKLNNSVTWREYKRKSENKLKDLVLSTKRLGKTKDGFLLLEFEVKSNIERKLEPSVFWIYQGNEKRLIHSLFISDSKTSKDKVVFGTASIALSDLVSQVAGSLELKLSERERLKVELPREVLWRK
jgi:hypothetical protein